MSKIQGKFPIEPRVTEGCVDPNVHRLRYFRYYICVLLFYKTMFLLMYERLYFLNVGFLRICDKFKCAKMHELYVKYMQNYTKYSK